MVFFIKKYTKLNIQLPISVSTFHLGLPLLMLMLYKEEILHGNK